MPKTSIRPPPLFSTLRLLLILFEIGLSQKISPHCVLPHLEWKKVQPGEETMNEVSLGKALQQ